MRIAVWGFGRPVTDTLGILKSCEDIEIAYVKADYRRKDIDDFIGSLAEMGYNDVYVDEIPDIEVDFIYLINYNRIIPQAVTEKYTIVNYHVGILPKWRGNSANGWAVINGEKYVGYTIHIVNGMLDDGPILYQFRFEYEPGLTYFDARKAMSENYRTSLPRVLRQFHAGEIVPVHNPGCDFVYCPTFRPVDGIVDWSESSDAILRRFFVFAPPLGTGLKFSFKGREYSISKISSIPRFAPAVSIPGSIVYKQGGSMWVKTGDTAVSVDGLTCEEEDVDIPSTFIIGQRL